MATEFGDVYFLYTFPNEWKPITTNLLRLLYNGLGLLCYFFKHNKK